MKLQRIALALFAVLATGGVAALAAGQFPNYPIVGEAAYCGGFSSGPTGQVCTVTVPAGPATLTGNETIPMDTNLAQGAQPQTVVAPLSTLGLGPYQYAAPLTGTTVTVNAGSRRLVLDPAGTIAALTVALPAAAALNDGQLFGLCSTQVVTALTLTAGSGTTVLNNVTALAIPPATGAGTCYEWVYRVTNTSWYRTQ